MSLLAGVPGFPSNQTSLNPAGPAAAHIEHTFALIFWITATVYLLTLAALVYFVWRRRYTLNKVPGPQPTTRKRSRRSACCRRGDGAYGCVAFCHADQQFY